MWNVEYFIDILPPLNCCSHRASRWGSHVPGPTIRTDGTPCRFGDGPALTPFVTTLPLIDRATLWSALIRMTWAKHVTLVLYYPLWAWARTDLLLKSPKRTQTMREFCSTYIRLWLYPLALIQCEIRDITFYPLNCPTSSSSLWMG